MRRQGLLGGLHPRQLVHELLQLPHRPRLVLLGDLGRDVLGFTRQAGAHGVEVETAELLVKFLLGGEIDHLLLWLQEADTGALDTEHLVHQPLVGQLGGEGGDEVDGPVYDDESEDT